MQITTNWQALLHKFEKNCKDFSVKRSNLVLVRIRQNDDKPTESGPATPPVLVLVSSNEEEIKNTLIL